MKSKNNQVPLNLKVNQWSQDLNKALHLLGKAQLGNRTHIEIRNMISEAETLIYKTKIDICG